MNTEILVNEFNGFIKTLESIENIYPEFYNEIAVKYREKLDIIKARFNGNNSEETDSAFYFRKLLLEENNERNYFTISSKESFSKLPSGEANSNWGATLIFDPLNDHSRIHLKKGDVLFCYRQGQFGDLNEALNMRGIYAVGIAASDPKLLFPDRENHNQWGVLISFPIQLPRHLSLRNIQMHPNTIDLTPYNGNRNDALQHIPNERHYRTLLNMLYSCNIEIKNWFENYFTDLRFEELFLPATFTNNNYKKTIEGNHENSTVKNNFIQESFVKWLIRPENYKKSYDGLCLVKVLNFWSQSFFNNSLFEISIDNIDSSIAKIKELIEDKNNLEWIKYSEATSHGSPSAILGKNNYYKFLDEFVKDDKNLKSISIKPSIALPTENTVNQKPVDEKYPHNLIVYGAPGTGKSYILNKRVEVYFPDDYFKTRVTFHPNYSYRNFIGSYKPKPVYAETSKKIFLSNRIDDHPHQKEPMIEYEFEPGPFLSMLVKALKPSNVNYNFVIVIEEINRANTAAVFGDIFQLLDRNSSGESEYSIALEPAAHDYLKSEGINSNSIRIPKNLYLWATMNNADQGVLPLDSAFKRRWSFEHVGIDDGEEKRDGVMAFPFDLPGGNSGKITWRVFRKKINTILIGLSVNEDKLIGPFFLKESEIALKDSIKNKLLMYLKEDALKYKSGLFEKFDNDSTFSAIAKNYDAGKNVFDKNIKWFED
jgi:hypothetical protein